MTNTAWINDSHADRPILYDRVASSQDKTRQWRRVVRKSFHRRSSGMGSPTSPHNL